MSGSVDDEVVRMRFDNNAFERGVSTTLGTLAKLKNSLNFSGADKGLNGVESKLNKLDMSGANKSIDESARHWSAWKTAGLIAFATVVHRAVDAGINMVKAFTVNPIAEGFKSYETQIDAAKIIMSNTGAKLPAIEKQLGQLQTYANQTVYSFADMAKNIGTFTAAGVKLVPATSAIKGMGNSAALSGANVMQLNSAMYQMSQAMSSGVIRLQDWNSLSNANMGGQNIQKALMATAQTIDGTGPKMDAAIKKYGNFRQSLTAGWLTADVFSKTMGVMAGTVDKATGKTRAFTVAELKAKGYTQAHAEQLSKLSQAAIESATQIRTYTQLTQALKEEVGTAYGALFKTLFGNLNGATTLFTALHTVAENALTAPIYALNNLIKGVVKLGGRAKVIDAFKNAFHALGAVLKPIKDAFREIFPPATAKTIYGLIVQFDNFTKRLKIGADTANNIKRIFAGVFAVLDIGKQIVGAIFHVIGQLFGIVSHGSGGFLSMAANVGDMVVAFDKALKAGNLFHNLFQIIGNVLSIPVHLLGVLGTLIGGLFGSFHVGDAKGMTTSVTNVGNALGHVAKITQRVSDWFGTLSSKIRPAVQYIVQAFSRIGASIAHGLGSASFGNILKSMQVGLLGGIVLMLKKFLKGGVKFNIGGGLFGQAKEALEGVTGTLKAMQVQLKAKALLEIAAALGILVASVVALTFVNPNKLQAALGAMAAGFAELLTAMGVLTKITGSAGFIKIPILAASLNLLATAILILSAAVIAMSMLSWDQLERGLTAIGLLLAGISAAAIPLSANSGGILRAGLAITAIAVAMNLLFVAVKAFSTMSWSEMLKGLAGVGIALAGIAIAMRAMPRGMTLQAAAILMISVALNALYLAVKEFSTLSWSEMAKGLVGVAGGLIAIAAGMKLMPPGLLLQAVALNFIGVALLSIGKAITNMGGMSWSEIGKGLATLAASLTILAIALDFMTGSLGGAAALLVVSAALKLFIPSLQVLASMSWGSILKGLVALAASFAVIGVASALLLPVIPAMLALGAALALLGVAMLAFGAGAALLGTGLTAIAASGGAAIAVLLGGVKSFIQLFPVLLTSVATGLVNFLTIIGKNAPAIIAAFVHILTELLQAIPRVMPSLITAFNSIVQALLTVLTTNAPKIIAAGFQLLMDLLNGIKNNITQVTTTVVDIIVRFLNTLAANIGRIVQAGVNLLFKFLEGVARAAGRIPGEVLKIVGIFLSSLFGNFPKILSAGIQLLGKLIGGILSGIGNMGSAAGKLIGRFLSAIGGFFGRLVSKGGEVLGKLVGGILGGIAGAARRLGSAAWDMAKALVDGIVNGIKNLAGKAVDAVKNLGSSLIHGVGHILGIGGPSREFCTIGETISSSTAIGIGNNEKDVVDAVNQMGGRGLIAMKKTMAGLGKVVADSSMDYNPTVAPVLDLTQFSKDASLMQGMIPAPSVSPDFSSNQANNIYASRAADQAAEATTPAAAPAPNVFKYEQNNYSPKALSAVDVYRLTNNQLSTVKKALGVPQPQVQPG